MEISKVLMDRILSNLGFKSIGVGVTSKGNILSRKLKLQEEDSSINEYDIFAAECHATSPPLKVVGSNIGTIKDPDLIVVIDQDDTTIVLKYSFKEFDQGTFFTKYQNKWVDMTVLAQLNLATATELITQEGLPWSPATDQDHMFGIIASILSEN